MLGIAAAATPYSDDPVNLSTGNFVYDHEDLKIGGEIPLSFHRYYNSKDRRKGSLGRCFIHNYESRLEENKEKGKVTVFMEDGQKKTFKKLEDGTYRSLYSATETLARERQKGEEKENGEQQEYYVLAKLSGERRVYDPSGRMIRQENRYGRGITFSYDEAGKLERAETDNDTYLTYSYDGEGMLICVADHTGRKVELSYERGKLAAVKVPSGSVYAYRYTKNGRLEEAVNPRGYTAVKNTYDEKRRVIRQEFPDGGHMEFAYDDKKRQVILTERNGSKTTYVHDSKYRNTDILYEDGTKEHFGYNEKNQRILYIDRNGNTTRMAYDNRGNLIQAINALGEKMNLTYNAANQLMNLKVNGKEKLRNSYDRNGNLLSSVGADGYGNRINYDSDGRPVCVEDADKNITTITYDDRGNVKIIRDGNGTEINYQYDGLNRVCRTTNGNGNITLFEYDDADRIKKVINSLGDSRSYSYNESGKVTKVTDYDGFSVQMGYNSLNKPETITDKEGNITHLCYDRMWNVSELRQANGGIHSYQYDGANRLKEEHLPEGGVVYYTYDGNGNRISETDREGNKTSYIYDALNRVIEEQKPEGAVTYYKYDTEGNLERITDALGNKTIYAYTPAGKVAKIIYPNGTEERYVYQNGLVKKVYKANGEELQYQYDGNGNIISVVDGAGEEIRYGYDALNRMVRQETEEGICLYEYDSVGNLRLFTDENGNTTKYGYSPNGNLNKVTDALGNETCYSYDCMGNLIKIEQTREMPHSTVEGEKAGEYGKQVTIYERDLEGRVTKIIDPAGYAEHYAYDKNGRITEKQDKDNFRTIFHYGKTGNLTEILYGDGRSVMLSYDALHHLETIKDWNGATKIMTDALGRTLSVTEPDGRTVFYEWGAGGEKRALTYPDGQKAEYSYNDRGLLEGLTTGQGTIKYAYDENGRLTKKELPNGVVTSYAYGRRGRIRQIRHEGEEFLESYKYYYDAAGNKILAEKKRSGIEEDQGCFAYQYDALNRLIQVKKDGERLREYEYDSFGNRTIKREYADDLERIIRYSYNEKNQLLSETDSEIERSYRYDLRGNMTGVTVGGRQIKQFVFDAANRMSSSAELAGDVIMRAEYRYNGLGQRVGQNIWRTGRKSADITSALIDIPMLEMPEEKVRYTSDLTRTYYNMLCLDTEGKRQDFYWDSNVALMEEDGAESYYIHDDLGSPARLLDGRGGSREVYGYDEFGVDLCRKPGQFCQPIQPFGFTGYQREEAGEVYFAQARRYDARIGRFISEDFIKGFTTAPYTLNHYGYCWNRPLDLVDLDGQIPTWAKYVGTGVGVAAITVVAVIIAPATIAASAVVATIVAGAAIGGFSGGIANVITESGSFENGFSGGAINGAISVSGVLSTSPYISNAIGGTVGSVITDVLNNFDKPKENRKSFGEIYYSASAAGATQSLVAGGLSSLWEWQTGGWNIADRGIPVMYRGVSGLWDVLFANGISLPIGAITSIAASEIWKQRQGDDDFAKE